MNNSTILDIFQALHFIFIRNVTRLSTAMTGLTEVQSRWQSVKEANLKRLITEIRDDVDQQRRNTDNTIHRILEQLNQVWEDAKAVLPQFLSDEGYETAALEDLIQDYGEDKVRTYWPQDTDELTNRCLFRRNFSILISLDPRSSSTIKAEPGVEQTAGMTPDTNGLLVMPLPVPIDDQVSEICLNSLILCSKPTSVAPVEQASTGLCRRLLRTPTTGKAKCHCEDTDVQQH